MLDAIEGFWLAAFLRRSVVFYPIVNATHILALGALVTSAILMDLRILGLGNKVNIDDTVRLLRPVAVTALIVAVASGAMLFSVQPKHYAANPVFWTKITILGVALINAGTFVVRRQHLMPEAALTWVMVSASILLWLSVLFAGRAIAFFD